MSNELVQFWLEELGNPTEEEIEAEIKDVKGAITNEHIWELGHNGEEPINPHTENIRVLKEYLEALEEKLK